MTTTMLLLCDFYTWDMSVLLHVFLVLGGTLLKEESQGIDGVGVGRLPLPPTALLCSHALSRLLHQESTQ